MLAIASGMAWCTQVQACPRNFKDSVPFFSEGQGLCWRSRKGVGGRGSCPKKQHMIVPMCPPSPKGEIRKKVPKRGLHLAQEGFPRANLLRLPTPSPKGPCRTKNTTP